MSEVYIAAPFFNEEQLKIVENIKNVLEHCGELYFSPKDKSMFKQGDDPSYILDLNCSAIDKASYLVCVTDGKDIGTIWEAGYAYAKSVPIVYVWLGYKPEMKFNIMLAASGSAVVHSYDDLEKQVRHYIKYGNFAYTQTQGMLHE